MNLDSQNAYEQNFRKDVHDDYYVELENHTLHSVFQPIFDADKSIMGLEALLRVKDRQGNFIRPDLFINDPTFSEHERLNIELLTRAIHIRNFAKHYANSNIRLFLNVLPHTLVSIITDASCRDNGLLCRRLRALGMEPEDIVFEVLENACSDNTHLLEAVDKLKCTGFSFAIDDFGCLYSDKTRVRELSPNLIKIDRSYLLDYCSGNTESVMKALLLAEIMNAKVVVEGIEEKDQYNKMKELELDYFQGYLLGRPNPIRHWVSEYAH